MTEEVGETLAVGLRSAIFEHDGGPLTFKLIPVELGLDNRITGEYMDLECYPDRFVLNGEPATDAEVIAFLKKLAAGWDVWLRAEQARMSER